MANRFAITNGDFNSTATWSTTAGGSGGASVPTIGDNAIANNRTVTITTNVTCDNLYNDTTGSATSGGTFQCSTAGVTITATFRPQATTNLMTISNATGTVSIVGDLLGGSALGNRMLIISGVGAVNITGNVTGGAANSGAAIRITGAASVTVTGNVSAGGPTNAAHGIELAANCNLTVVGSVSASTGGGNAIEYAAGAPTFVRVTGTITATNTGVGIYTVANTTPNYLTGPFVCSADGTSAIVCRKWLWDTSVPASRMDVRTETSLALRPLYTADSVGGNPVEADVRDGTVYGPISELTGTLVVPAASSVAYGVPVDNTTGTAVLTMANVRDAVGLASANLDTQLGTIDTVVDAVKAKTDNLPSDPADQSAVEAAITAATSPLATASDLATVAGYLDTEIAAIKGKTDQLTFTVANQVDSNALTGGLDAAGVRAAVGLASANLDTQLSGLDTAIDAVPTAAETWAHVIESGFTAAEVMRILSAVAAGSASGLENGSPSFTGLDGATTRVAGTYASGTRTVTTVDGT